MAITASKRAKRQKIRDYMRARKLASGCIDCGYRGHFAALDFDHVRGEKRWDPCQLHKGTIRQAMAELAKCEVRCANCHRIETFRKRVAAATSAIEW